MKIPNGSGREHSLRNLLLASVIAVALLYGKTLRYEFVYDDDWRIARNPAVQTLQSPAYYLLNPASQAGLAKFSSHTYRPLPTYIHALGVSFWGNKPGLFRLQNLILHALNGFLIAGLGIALFNLSPPAAGLGALFFLLHPTQTEAVVWVSELSGVLAMTWLLMGLTAWVGYRQGEGSRNAALAYLFLILGFLTRETSVCLAPALILIDVLMFKKWDKVHHPSLVALTLLYLVARNILLGQMGQAPLWGGTALTHAANILQTLPIYLQYIFAPHSWRISHMSIPIAWTLNPAVIKGLLVAIGYVALLVFTHRRSKDLFVCFLLAGLFWLPGSNIVPLNTLFAERLIYPIMGALAWAAGKLFDAQPWKRPIKFILPTALLLLMGWKTNALLPVWQNEDTLWRNAAKFEPDNYFAWACLANAQMKKSPPLPDEAETYFLRALDCRPAPPQKGEILVALAIVNFQQGRKEEAMRIAEEGLKLRPDLRERVSFISPTAHYQYRNQ